MVTIDLIAYKKNNLLMQIMPQRLSLYPPNFMVLCLILGPGFVNVGVFSMSEGVFFHSPLGWINVDFTAHL